MNRTILHNPDAPRLRGAAVMYGMLRNFHATRLASVVACVRYLFGATPIRVETPTSVITINFFSVS